MPNRGRSKKNRDEISDDDLEKDKDSKKKGENLAKEVSKDKREDFKQEVAKRNKKRRRRPRKKGPVEQKPALPTPEYEERFNAEEQVPINPFEAAELPVSTIEKKALEDKPLDRKDQEIKSENVEQIAEEVDQIAEQMGEQGAANEAEAADVAEKAKEQAVVAEVVEARPELERERESEQEQPLEGVVQPAEVEEFKEELWDILAQAGITKKRLIVILLIIVFGVLFIWFAVDDGAQKVVEKSDDVEEGDVSGIISSYVFGLEFEVPKTPIQAVPIGKSGTLAGVDTALYFGEGESDFENRYVYYIDLLRKMDSIYHTDVYSLIDPAVDRRAALTEHINELEAIIQEADSVYFEIKSRLESFDKEFEILAVERDELEERFFVAIEELMPRSANDYLESFIEVQHDSNELKAYYNAYRAALDLVIAYLDVLEPRYQDIVVNTEALIKGIRVFDVPASDIDAILPIGGELE